MSDLLRALGLVPRGANYETVKFHAASVGVDLSGILFRPALGRCSDEEVAEAVRRSRSYAQARVLLGLSPLGSNQALKRRIARMGLDTSHFLGQGWKRGDSTPPVPPRPLDEYLIEGRLVATSTLRKRLIAEGLKEPRCEMCRRERWNGKPIPLELDHVSGRREDNRIENLRLLCPNCHAQTDTYRGRNIGSGGSYSVGVSPGAGMQTGAS
ncbi:MAG: HNH endonuclease [Actinobacteria bacterium]|nr:HNH endonuclease [Actinomycetota bacterium]